MGNILVYTTSKTASKTGGIDIKKKRRKSVYKQTVNISKSIGIHQNWSIVNEKYVMVFNV